MLGVYHVDAVLPEALSTFYKRHLQDLLKRRMPNLPLFEAYVQYCFSPKHTTGGQQVAGGQLEKKLLIM
jgi:hypothetical protein